MITVVSGLPRSGTSLMMKVLESYGLNILTDGLREPNYHNPNGYYEYEAVKNLHVSSEWMNHIDDVAVKIVSHQLRHIPRDLKYRVIFMTRNLEEVIQSQNKMMSTEYTPPNLKENYRKHVNETLTWLRVTNTPHIVINYNNLIKTPETELSKVAAFIKTNNPVDVALNIVDEKLWRNRNT